MLDIGDVPGASASGECARTGIKADRVGVDVPLRRKCVYAARHHKACRRKGRDGVAVVAQPADKGAAY